MLWVRAQPGQKMLGEVFKRYNIVPSRAARLEYDFATRIVESELSLQRANT